MSSKENTDVMGKRTKSLILVLLLALSSLGASLPNAQAAARPAPYYIMVNRAMNTVTVYGLDANGNHTVPVKAMVCSVGRQGSATPRGQNGVVPHG